MRCGRASEAPAANRLPRGKRRIAMSPQHTRREFLADVGRGMLIASVGYGAAVDMGLSPALADAGPEALSFGDLEPLVELMQETSIARLVPVVVDQLQEGTSI